jgi:hypothetical protein
MHRPFTPEIALSQARTIACRAAARSNGAAWKNSPLSAGVLVRVEGERFCRVRDTSTGQTSLFAVSPRVFDALKRARGTVTVFVQDEKIVGFVI